MAADSVDKAFEDLLVLNLCLKRIHWFSSGIPGKEMRKDGDQCASCGHWSLILNGFVEKSTVSVKSLVDACRVGRVDAVRSIVSDYEVDVDDSSDECNGSVLHMACDKGHDECAHLLMETGANVNISNSFGSTPLHTACWHNSIELIQALLKAGANVHAKGYYGMTPLFISCIKGYTDCARLMLEAGADVNTKNMLYDQTALHQACEKGHNECARLLLETGADVNAANSSGWTSLHTACCRGNDECVRLLEAHLEREKNVEAPSAKRQRRV